MFLSAPAACLWLGATALPTAGGEAYDRAVAEALRTAQAELLEATDLWQDHSRWESAWEVESDHYRVRSTHSRYLAASLAEDMDTMLGHFQSVLGTSWTPREPLEIWVFPTLADYNAFGNSDGADHSSLYPCFHAVQNARRPVATMFSPNLTQLRMWITHGATHQFITEAFQVTPPAAIDEGLAAYFSLYWDPSYAASEHDRVAKGSGFIPLRQLLSEPITSYADRPHDRSMELGTLFTYLLHFREDTCNTPEGEPGEAADYIRAVLTGRNAAGLPMQRLLSRDLDAFEEDFRAFTFPHR